MTINRTRFPHESSVSGSLETFLKNLGFTGHPFASLEAGKEEGEEWFYASFVEPPRFSEIVGDARFPRSMLVFAPRGCGKTALRVMLDYYCRRGYIPGGKVLSILHTDLSAIEEAERLNPQIPLSRFHAEMILRAGLAALCRQAKDEPALQNTLQDELKSDERAYLRWYVYEYGRNLSLSQMRLLRQLNLYPESQEGLGFLPKPKQEEGPTQIFSDLLEDKRLGSYVSLLGHFVDLVRRLGFQAVYILIDGVDELAETAADFSNAARLIKPLAANLKLLDLPGIAFRFFLPAEIRPYMEMSENVRRDRVLWYDLKWDTSHLLELLHKRLLVFSRYHIESLDQICVDALKGGRLESEMVEACGGSPRTLLRLGQETLNQQAVMMKDGNNWLISETAWQRAREMVLSPFCQR